MATSPELESDDTPTLPLPPAAAFGQDTNTCADERTVVSNGDNGPAAGAAIGDMQELPENIELGKYRIRRLLGKGAMGAVYLAFDPMIERDVAIKVFPAKIGRHPMALSRFLTEARSIGRLNHPNVVSIYDIAEQGKLHYIVMELLAGGSVGDMVTQHRSLDWKEACRLVMQAAEGLSAAHAVGLVHRDIKPDNLMTTKDGIVKIVDFGLSKLVDAASDTRDAKTREGAILGTPQYMSPEQCESHAVDGRSDIYSLGGTLFRLLTGRLPYEEYRAVMQAMMAHVNKPVPDPLKHRPDLPEALRTIVSRAMAKTPEDRYQDAAELAHDLKALLYGNSGVADTPASAAPQQFRSLQSIVIVEPSRMQALMQQKAFTQAGIETIEVCANIAAARDVLETSKPDVLITAMELDDGRGPDLLSEVRSRTGPATMLVLNSSDATIDTLVEAGQTGPFALVSKRTKPDEIIRSIHACTCLNVAPGPLTEAIDAVGVRLLFVCDSKNIPDVIAEQVRRTGLLDVQVTTFDDLVAGFCPSGTIDLAMAVRTAGQTENDTVVYTELLSRVKTDAQAVAALRVDGDSVVLRAIRSGGFVAVADCLLDDARLTRLVQVIQK